MNIIRSVERFHHMNLLEDDHHQIQQLDRIHTNPNDEQDRCYSNRLRFYAKYEKRSSDWK